MKHMTYHMKGENGIERLIPKRQKACVSDQEIGLLLRINATQSDRFFRDVQSGYGPRIMEHCGESLAIAAAKLQYSGADRQIR
jgi:hypothetical protein